MIHWTDANLMLGQRRRRWPNIRSASDQRLVFIWWPWNYDMVPGLYYFLVAFYTHYQANLEYR